MPLTHLAGPFSLTHAGVNMHAIFPRAGVFALGRTENGLFIVRFVGSAANIRARLNECVALWYPEYMFGYFLDVRSAFEWECHLYHAFSPPDNHGHPVPPASEPDLCPVFDCPYAVSAPNVLHVREDGHRMR